MTPRDIIARAWTITQKEVNIRTWGFATSLLQTLLSAKLFIYQTWFAYSYFVLREPIGFFTMEEVLLEHLPHTVAWAIIITFLLLVVVELLFPHIAAGAIIGLAAKSYRKEEVKGGAVLGLYNFFRIFAANEAFALNSLTLAITLASLALRYGGNAALPSIWIIGFIFVLSNILKFTAIFAEEAIVIRKVGFLAGWKESFKLIVSYLGHIMFLLLLTFIITLRIFINALIIFIVPGIVMAVGFVLTMFLPHVIGWSLAVILGFALIVIASHFFAYLEVFRQTVWTITYLELSEKKDLDVILEE